MAKYPWWELALVRWGGEHAQVVAHVVAPLLGQNVLDGRPTYVDTDWWQGPHVSVCFPASPEEAQTLCTSGLVARAQELLTSLGPGPETNPAQHQDLHERLARYERRPGPLEPWLPDGQALLRPLPPREDGGGSELDLTVQQAHTALREAELDLFAQIARGELRVEAHALDLLASVATRFTDSDLRATYPSFASHAEAYLATDATPGTRERWDEAYARHQPSLVRLLEQRIHQTTEGTLPANVAAVTDVFAAVADSTDPLALFGGSALPASTGAFSSSEFHTELSHNHGWQNAVRYNAWFARYRLVVNLAYRHLSKLGLSPHHRFYTCHLLTRAAQDLTRTTASDVLKGLSRA
ncbi:lantibiotic dehydratase C-terminal domain-containing protein [Nesterenkonia alkaliphila]|uniref:Thiopeptide-type bacteriocin biosynthesis domain-containing protein n=1 Tax=Nesterenkonia alkaliphila TaxID=1463631 RepID=A0A7K1UG83_9MICC|nr:lantibiotic dehydratase C-terminal domain-containing protein [Nesterenkonia alkaliphila]MVT25111.1 hypothetical protein [Nesterenkonia alkaliphila]GFZ82849.1 hypothetical protein GCM10011359_09440 [Nesterenkonia alkaliphila]